MRPGPIDVALECCSTCGAKFNAAAADWSGPAHSARDCVRVLAEEVQTLRAELDVVRAGWRAAVRFAQSASELEAAARRDLEKVKVEVEALRTARRVDP